MGDVDGAEQLFKARENWIQVDASVPFFDIDIDPSIGSEPSEASRASSVFAQSQLPNNGSRNHCSVKVNLPRADQMRRARVISKTLHSAVGSSSEPLLCVHPFCSATIQAQILFDRGEAEAAVRLITRYPVARHDILVQRACNQGGPEAGLKLLNTIERITCKRVQMPATFPLLVWYYKVQSIKSIRALSAT